MRQPECQNRTIILDFGYRLQQVLCRSEVRTNSMPSIFPSAQRSAPSITMTVRLIHLDGIARGLGWQHVAALRDRAAGDQRYTQACTPHKIGRVHRPGRVPLPSKSPGTRYPPLLAHPAAPGNGVQGRLRRRAKRACSRPAFSAEIWPSGRGQASPL
jgi:hypothetical protein